MKRYLKYILLALISVALAVSCIEELEPTPSMTDDDEVAVLVPRIKSFTNQYVTRSDYSEAEMTISSLKVLVFNNDRRLVHHDDIPVDSRTISLNKSMLNSSANGDLKNATVVMLANMDLSRLKKDNTPLSSNLSNLQLSDLENYSYSHEQSVYTSLQSGFKGFPMIGGTTGVDLSPTSSSNQQDPVVVDLKILYAKVNFQISVEQGGENQRVDPSNTQQMQFQLDKYAVFNASAVTTLAIPTTEGEPVHDFLGNIPNAENIASVDEPTLSSTYSYPASGSGATHSIGKTVALGGASIPFTFYIAESRYNHNLESLDGIYPDSEWLTSAQNDDVKGWDTLTEDQKKLPQNKLNGVKYLYDDLIQQYKPKLADVAGASPGKGLASYVRLTGKYTDYRGTVWDVNYDVYLGKDNSQNFHVDRNSEYTNIITIKGLRNNDSYGEEQVWFDHRVDVSLGSGQGADDCVTITRETLLDAHIEVRPMRVQWEEGKYAGVRVYLPIKDGTLVNWIGIERFTGANCQDSATYCYADGKSTGKRRYFTTSLISELQTKKGELGVQEDTDGRQFVYLQNGDCAWIYFDENTFTGDTRNTAREAVIMLEFFDDSGKVIATENYHVKQEPLRLIPKVNYNVESYEEYLHSYDSADKYNLSTSPADYSQQGLSWGLADRTISQTVIASSIELGSLVQYVERVPGLENLKYDFYHDSDGSYHRYMKNENGDWVKVTTVEENRAETGWAFTDRATRNTVTTVIDMGSVPENAYQYCLSKNKFEADDEGKVKMVLKWYLPDVHQLKSVLNATEDGVSDFKSDDFYWSSQPTYNDDNTIPLGSTPVGLLVEVPSQARAISKAAGVVDTLRTSKNRIRCLYAKSGTEIDMTGRTPDGIGGLTSIVMNGLAADGYFNYYVKNLGAKDDDIIITDEHPEITYPTEDNSNESGPEFKYVTITDKSGKQQEGFEVNPQENWKERVFEFGKFLGYEIKYETGYYTTLATYPGLTEMTLDKMGESIFDQKRKIGNIEYTYREIAELLNIDIDNFLIIDAYKPTTTPKSRLLTKLSTKSRKLNKGLPSSTDLLYLDHVKGGKKFSINFAKNSGASDPIYVYDETTSGTKTDTTYKWEKPVYTGTPHQLADERSQSPITASGDGSEVNTNVTRDQNTARSNAESRARDEAKTNALNNLKNVLSNYPGWEYDGDPTITYSTSKYSNERKILGYWTTTCSVTATASVYLKRGGTKTLYLKTSGGKWTPTKSSSNEVKLTINSDQLRMYCGNSFTISLSDQVDEEGLKYSEAYEITKVIVHFSGNNLIKKANGFYGVGEDEYYARLVDSTIDLTKYSQTISKYGGAEVTLQLPGMEYVEQSDNSSGIHQWSGEGRSSVTLVLADYVVMDNAEQFSYEYKYQTAKTDLTKYIVIDKIEVKCTKKATASE